MIASSRTDFTSSGRIAGMGFASARIIGFAAMVLTYRSQPAVDNIQGAFLEFYPLTTVPAGYHPPSADDVTYFLGLIR